MLRLSRIIPITAAALVLGAVACDRSLPTGTDKIGRPSLAVQVGTIVCNVDNTVSGVTNVSLAQVAGFACGQFNAGNITQPVLESILGVIQALDQGGLTQGQINSYSVKLQHVIENLAEGDFNTAVNQLNAFINEAQTMFNDLGCGPGDIRPVCKTLKSTIDAAQHLLAQLVT
jgi:hypothetical protein